MRSNEMVRGKLVGIGRVVGVAVVVVFASCVLAVPASAESPWWHLSSGARPTDLQAGMGVDEVQEINVAPATAFGLEVAKNSIGVFESDPYPFKAIAHATAENVQKALEAVYGAGEVTVTGGPGGVAPLLVRSPSRPVPPIEAGKLGGAVEAKVVKEGRSDGQIVLTATNLGDGSVNGEINPVRITDTVPAGLKVVGIEGVEANQGKRGAVECSVETVTCSFTGILPPYNVIEVRISVNVEAGAGAISGLTNEASVSGGEAPAASVRRPVLVGGLPTSFGVEYYEMTPQEEGGVPDTQAGSHPFQLTTTLTLNQTQDAKPAQLVKDLHFKLPPGLIGNPTPFPQCTMQQFLTEIDEGTIDEGTIENLCPPQSVVGVATVSISLPSRGATGSLTTATVPLFNLEPAVGEPARFGFYPTVPVILDTSIRTGGDYGVTVKVDNITETAAFLKNEVTFWGVPGDPRHDNARGWACLKSASLCTPAKEHNPPPLIVMPPSCSGTSLQTSVEADPWVDEGDFLSFPSSEPMPTLDGCNRLPFDPSISVAPDGQQASTPTGLTVSVHVPQDASLNPAGLAESSVRDTTVVLPAGVAVNPAAADGLEACSEEQVALSVDAEALCPEASKVATLEIKSPLLPNPLVGEAYLAAQNTNPFGTLLALYLVAQDPVSGVLVKVAGEVKLDPVTGQLVSTFKDTPQLPFEDLHLHFFGGDRAPLATPASCGAYTTMASVVPWSGNAAAAASSTFNIVSGPNGLPCHDPLLFNPSLTAGTTSIQAGGFTPFTMTVSREDGQQGIKAFQLHMPPGLSGLLNGVKLCGETEADAGTCGSESLIGETTVSVGLGGDPYSVTGGKVYITGPYEGAPFGVSVVVRAKAGPYDLGNVIVRGTIMVDPITAALTVTIDDTGPYKIPTILDGIPLQIRHINFTTTRPGFTFNPTDCDAMSVTGSMSSTEGATAGLSVPFQVTNCAVLAFKPGFKVSTSGKTSRAKGASLSVKLTYPKAAFGSQANIRSVKVDLPKQLPSRLTTLQKACTAAQFQANPAGCPAASMVGHATAVTPLIPVPLTGPAYFVSYGGAKFPELVIVLQGYGVTLDLHGETFISKAGITSSTFHTIPDAPVGSFELTLPQGKFSALAANGNLCKRTLRMPTLFVAQNGARIKQSTPVGVTGCAKKAHRVPKGGQAGKRHKGQAHGKKK